MAAMMRIGQWARTAACALAVAALGGCATTGTVASSQDPAEGFNRTMFAFNEGMDALIVRPVARGYEFALPSPVRTGIANFFANIGDVFIGVNDLLQGKPQEAATDVGRFVINSTVGVLGLVDVATDLGLEKHDEDFGQTFGRWGAGPGPYVVLPVFGPRTVRDGAGLAVDLTADPVGYIDRVAVRNSLVGLRYISDRTALLPADKVIEEAALDKYAYVRDGYLQLRQFKVYDGNPPRVADPDAP